MQDLVKKIKNGAKKIQVDLNELQVDQLVAYLQLLDKWNKPYNLSAIRNIDQMVTHHILDSLVVAPFVESCQRMLDVGTGAGLPGIVLAIFYPQHQFHLLDGNGKKIRFLVQLKHSLKLANITPVHKRVEDYRVDECFDGIISRAVGPIKELIAESKHLLCRAGHWYAMKGTYPEAELQECTYPYHVTELYVPALEGSRHLVTIEG